MVRAVSKYSLLSISPPQSQFERHKRRRTTTNHREPDRTIAQTFISALHLYETRILRFTIDHLRASLGQVEPPRHSFTDSRLGDALQCGPPAESPCLAEGSIQWRFAGDQLMPPE